MTHHAPIPAPDRARAAALLRRLCRLTGLGRASVAELPGHVLAEWIGVADLTEPGFEDAVRHAIALFDLSAAEWLALSGPARSDAITRAMTDRAALPDGVSREIPVSIARGPMWSYRIPNDPDLPHEIRRGAAVADVFDLMARDAARRKVAFFLTWGQVAVARRYRALHDEYTHGVAPKSCLDMTPPGGGGPGSFMERRAAVGAELAQMQDRIGTGLAAALRKTRPSARSRRGAIRDRWLVDRVALHDRSLSQVLTECGFPANAHYRARLRLALCDVLDRMRGPEGRSRGGVVHYGGAPGSPWQ